MLEIFDGFSIMDFVFAIGAYALIAAVIFPIAKMHYIHTEKLQNQAEDTESEALWFALCISLFWIPMILVLVLSFLADFIDQKDLKFIRRLPW